MIGLKNRGSLPAITEDEFEHLVAQFRGLFLAEHNEDGTHITRDRELDFVPVGTVMGWLTGTPPTGWILLDGTPKNRLTYQGLFNLWGTTFGVGDGSTTFNTPDMRGRFFLGKAASGTGSILGGTGGAIDHTHSIGAHTHTISSSGTHTHDAGTLAGPSHTHGSGSYVTPTHNHTGATGVGSNEIERQPGGLAPYDTQTFDHTHPISTQAAMAITGTSGSGGTGAVTGSTAAGGSHDHGGVTGEATAATSGTANPPFLAGNWIAFAGVA